MTKLPLSKVRMNLSSLVQRAAKGTPIAVTVRGRVSAYLVSAQTVERSRSPRRPKVRGSLVLRKPLEGTRADFLRWLGGQA